jgi:uncharacterized ferredoxin-like protein
MRAVAELMALAARTAPKAMGRDFIATAIVEGDDLQRLGEEMIRDGERISRPKRSRDGRNVLESDAVVLIGLQDPDVLGLNCGACGSERCIKPGTYDGEYRGPNCAIRILDMGIALGSAVKTASLLNADNRIMYNVGSVARKLGLIDADLVMGIPLSATGKSLYFDR